MTIDALIRAGFQAVNDRLTGLKTPTAVTNLDTITDTMFFSFSSASTVGAPDLGFTASYDAIGWAVNSSGQKTQFVSGAFSGTGSIKNNRKLVMRTDDSSGWSDWEAVNDTPVYKWQYKTAFGTRFQSYEDGRFISNADANYGSSDVTATESAGTGTTPLIEWENVSQAIMEGETLNFLNIKGRINDATNTPDVEIYIYFVTPDNISRLSAGWDNDNELDNTLIYKDFWKTPVTTAMGQTPNTAAANDMASRTYPLQFTAPSDGWITIIVDPIRLAASTGNDYFYCRHTYMWTPPLLT